MSLKGKNRAIFSYNNVDRNESNFVYKDFEKTRSYHSSFVGAKFTGIYTDEELIRYLPMLPQYVSSQFYTVSYLKTMLKKIKKSYII